MLVGVIAENFVAYPIDGSGYQRPIQSVSSGGDERRTAHAGVV